jgi:(p)ppGpp synthase/HD superfamily hydrolase
VQGSAKNWAGVYYRRSETPSTAEEVHFGEIEELMEKVRDDVSTLERAIAIAAEAHAGRVDKAGAPYVLHPLRMMLSMTSIDERIVAVMHDVCEDCPGWTFDRLRREGFPDHIIEALQSVTKRDGEDYEEFVRRAVANPIGRRVKLADMQDNSDLSRITVPTERDLRRIEKYQRAIDLINRLPA